MQLTLDNEEFPAAEGTGLLARLGRRKSWCLLGFGLTAAVVAVAFTAMPRTYRASASLLVASNEAVLRSGTASAEAQRLGDPADIESQMLILRSARLGRFILQDPKVEAALVADCEATRSNTWATALMAQATKPVDCSGMMGNDAAEMSRLEAGFSIGPTGRSRVIEVSFVSALPETAVILVNALVDAYLSDDMARKVDTHDNAINWLNTEISSSGQELRKAELAIEAYRSEHGIVRGQLASIASERLSALSQQLAAANAGYAQALSRTGPGSSDVAAEVLNSRTVSDLKQQSALLAARSAELRQRYGDSHPMAQAVADQRREVERRLDQESRRVGTSMQRDVGAAASRVAELTAQYDKLIHEVGNTGGAEAGIAIMVRDVEARREIYVDQLKKVNSLQTERRLLSGDARLVSHAELPERPWFPKRLPFFAVGAVLASAVGGGFGLLRDVGDRTLRASTNLPQLAGVPFAGYIPWVKRKRGSRWPVMHLHNATPLQEAVRALYGRFVLVPGRAPKTLMISSSEIGEGKTFLTLSLALFAATTKRRILVIEADMRRPTFRKALMLPTSGPGLREYLRSEASLADIITPYHGLHVITAGQPGIDSTELLSKGRFDSLLKTAKSHYDLIVVDSPPTLSLMDAQVMARRIDGIIYCASLGRSDRDKVEQGIRNLVSAGGNVLGIVVGGRSSSELPQYNVAGVSGQSYMPVPV